MADPVKRRFAADVADRVVFIDHGVIVEEGPARDVLTNPQSPRTRAFLRAVLDRAPMTEEGVEDDAGFDGQDLLSEVRPDDG